MVEAPENATLNEPMSWRAAAAGDGASQPWLAPQVHARSGKLGFSKARPLHVISPV